MVSSSLNLSPSSPRAISKVHPPCLKSSAPPGSSITPSSETNSVTTIFPISSSFALFWIRLRMHSDFISSLFGMCAVPPPPGAQIPQQPAALAARLDSTLRDLNAAVDRWKGVTARPPQDVTLEALYEQRISILLSEKPGLAKAVFRRVLGARQVRSDVAARRE